VATSTAPVLLTPRILWAAILMSQGIYLVMLNVPGMVDPSQRPDVMMALGMGAAACAAAVASFAIPAMLWGSAARTAKVTTDDAPAPIANPSYRAQPGNVRGFGNRDAALREGVRVGFAPFIIGIALNESVALCGFVLGFLGHPPMIYLPFFGLSVLLMLPRFPTERTFLKPIAEVHGIAF
jgi:hypothetical protein